MRGSVSDRPQPPSSMRVLLLVVLALDIVLTGVFWLAFPSVHSSARVIGGVFILLPLVVLFVVGIPFALLRSIRDSRDASGRT